MEHDYPKGFLKEEDAGEDFIPLSNVDGAEAVRKVYFPLRKKFETGQRTKLTKKGAPGFYQFTKDAFYQTNKWLRGTEDPPEHPDDFGDDFGIIFSKGELYKLVVKIDEEIAGTIIPVNIIVQKGVNGPDSEYGNLKPGDIFTDNGIVSASLSVYGAFDGKYILRIRIKAGCVAAFAPALSPFEEEAEVILPRRSSFFVQAVEKTANRNGVERTVIYCELLQQKGKQNEN